MCPELGVLVAGRRRSSSRKQASRQRCAGERASGGETGIDHDRPLLVVGKDHLCEDDADREPEDGPDEATQFDHGLQSLGRPAPSDKERDAWGALARASVPE